MKKEYKEFLYKFTSDDDLDGSPRQLSDREAELLNQLLTNVSEQDLLDYISTIGERFFIGFFFFGSCVDKIDLTNKEKFLQFTWIMFRDQADDTKTDGYHAWYGQFDPLYGEENSNSRYASLFREGFIKYDLDNDFASLYLGNSGWWDSVSNFFEEILLYMDSKNYSDFVNSFAKALITGMDKVASGEGGAPYFDLDQTIETTQVEILLIQKASDRQNILEQLSKAVFEKNTSQLVNALSELACLPVKEFEKFGFHELLDG